MARIQTLVQLSDELVARLDERARAEGRSRSELIRTAVAQFLDSDREATLDRAILDGYGRIPAVSDPWVAELAARSIDSEPW